MAKAKSTEIEVIKTEKVKGVVLELSQDEAQFLVDVLAAVGGDPSASRRRHQQPISSALYKLGFNYSEANKSGSITFY